MKEILRRVKNTFFSPIDLYFYREMLPNYIFGLMFFTILMMLSILFQLAKFYFEYHVPLAQVMMMLGTLLPFFISFSLPFAILPGYLLTMGRFSMDSEITAMKSCGISMMRFFLPGILFGLLMTVFAIGFKEYVEIPSMISYSRLRATIFSQRPVVELKEQGFKEVGGVKISFQGSIQEKGYEVLTNLHVIDVTGRRTIEAQSGRIFADPANPEHYIMKFRNGTLSEVTKRKNEKGKMVESFFIIAFKYLSISRYVKMPANFYSKSPETMTLPELKTEISNRSHSVKIQLKAEYPKLEKVNKELDLLRIQFRGIPKTNKKMIKKVQSSIKVVERKKQGINKKIKEYEKMLPSFYRMQVIDRYGTPIATFIFAFICLSLGMFQVRSGKSEGLGISIVLMLVHYGMKMGMVNMIKKQVLMPEFILLPNIIFAVFGIVLFVRKIKE